MNTPIQTKLDQIRIINRAMLLFNEILNENRIYAAALNGSPTDGTEGSDADESCMNWCYDIDTALCLAASQLGYNPKTFKYPSGMNDLLKMLTDQYTPASYQHEALERVKEIAIHFYENSTDILHTDDRDFYKTEQTDTTSPIAFLQKQIEEGKINVTTA